MQYIDDELYRTLGTYNLINQRRPNKFSNNLKINKYYVKKIFIAF